MKFSCRGWGRRISNPIMMFSVIISEEIPDIFNLSEKDAENAAPVKGRVIGWYSLRHFCQHFCNLSLPTEQLTPQIFPPKSFFNKCTFRLAFFGLKVSINNCTMIIIYQTNRRYFQINYICLNNRIKNVNKKQLISPSPN